MKLRSNKKNIIESVSGEFGHEKYTRMLSQETISMLNQQYDFMMQVVDKVNANTDMFGWLSTKVYGALDAIYNMQDDYDSDEYDDNFWYGEYGVFNRFCEYLWEGFEYSAEEAGIKLEYKDGRQSIYIKIMGGFMSKLQNTTDCQNGVDIRDVAYAIYEYWLGGSYELYTSDEELESDIEYQLAHGYEDAMEVANELLTGNFDFRDKTAYQTIMRDLDDAIKFYNNNYKAVMDNLEQIFIDWWEQEKEFM